MQNKKLRQSYEELQSSVFNLQGQVQNLSQSISGLSEAFAAVVSLLGEESVTQEMQRLRQERQEKQEQAMEDSVVKLVEAKVLVAAEATTEETLVVGKDQRPDGSTPRVQFEMKAVPEEIRPKFLGKKVGDVIENNGATMTVTAIYTIDKARAVEFQAEQQKKAQEALAAQVKAAEPSAEDNVAGAAKLSTADGHRGPAREPETTSDVGTPAQ